MKRALVTGGSGDLGQAICRQLAGDGLHIIVHACRHPERAEAVAAAIQAAGGSAETARFDVADTAQAHDVLSKLLDAGPIQVLINNAGVHADAPLAGMSLEQWRLPIEVCLHGFFNVTQPLLLPMIGTRWGRIINISSLTGVIGNRGQTNYAAAKAGLHGATKALALELASRGITVNAIAPGLIAGGDTTTVFDTDTVKRMVPMKRAGSPEEVAALVGFLASEPAAYLTGQIINLNGGYGVTPLVGIVVVIPAYNEAATIAGIVHRARQQVETVLVIDDGSHDDTALQAETAGAMVLRQPANQGKGAALWRGMQAALGAAAVISLDADGQHRPEDIPKLLEAWRRQPDRLIIAARLECRESAPRLRRFANGMADFWVSWAAGYPIRDTQSGFRLYPTAFLRKVTPPRNNGCGFVFESALLIQATHCGYPPAAVVIETLYLPQSRLSHYQPWRDTWRITVMVAKELLKRGLYPLGLLRSLGLWPVIKAGAGS